MVVGRSLEEDVGDPENGEEGANEERWTWEGNGGGLYVVTRAGRCAVYALRARVVLRSLTVRPKVE